MVLMGEVVEFCLGVNMSVFFFYFHGHYIMAFMWGTGGQDLRLFKQEP